jgi:hypothetical protein
MSKKKKSLAEMNEVSCGGQNAIFFAGKLGAQISLRMARCGSDWMVPKRNSDGWFGAGTNMKYQYFTHTHTHTPLYPPPVLFFMTSKIKSQRKS